MAFTKCDPSPAAALSRRPDARRHSIIQIRYISTPLKDKWRGTGRKEEFGGGGEGKKGRIRGRQSTPQPIRGAAHAMQMMTDIQIRFI